MKFKNYSNEDYQAVCDFLIELNREKQNHINWNWARFEWMMKHPEFDKSPVESAGLWMDGERVVGAAIYDMYSGEAFCGVLSEYETLYPEILDYAYRNLKMITAWELQFVMIMTGKSLWQSRQAFRLPNKLKR